MRPSKLRAFGDREADIVLRDGSTAHVRPVGLGDAEAVRSLFAGLSERSQYLRFFSVSPRLDTVVKWATTAGDGRRFGLVATVGGGDHLVAHAAYAGDDAHPDRAEVALAIADRMQGKGIGTLLLGQLAEAAAQAGVSTFTGEVLPENHQMIKVLRDSGFAVATRTLPGTILVEFPTSLTEEARDRFQRREHIAAVAAVRTVLAPRSVAVIGASRRRETIGGTLFHNLREAGFAGPVCNDLLDYWEEDPDTGVILLYLESFGNPRNFARIARRVGRSKPIVAVKSSRLAAGAEAGSSHIGALLAASDQTVDALFRQAGVLRADTLAESFDVARLLATQPCPPGRRVAILTNATGPGTVCVDACGAGDLEVPALSDDLEARLAGLLPDGAAIANPVDLPTSAPADAYREAIRCLARSGEVDAVVAIVVPLLATDPAVVLRGVGDDAVNSTIPVLAVVMSSAGAAAAPQTGERLPVYGFPEDAANALAHAARHHAWLTRSAGRVPELQDVRRDEAAGLLARALADGPTPRWLNPEEVSRLFDCYGLPMAEGQAARTAAEAGAGAQTIAGVAELAVGVVHDASFGPVVACSVGGPAAELLRDVAVRITPLTDTDAAEMVRSLAAFPLLDGYGGKPRADVAAVEDLLLRLSALVDTHPEVALLDCHPVVVRPADDGVTIVDARVRIQPAPPTPMVGARQP